MDMNMDTDMDLSPPIEPTTELAMELEENDPRRDACLHGVLSVFPDIDLAHLNKLALDHSFNQDWVMSQILDDQDEGRPYPKQPQCAQTPKRKKPLVEEDPIEAKRRKYDNPEHRMQQKTSWYSKTAKAIIAQDFPRFSHRAIQGELKRNGGALLPTYLEMHRLAKEADDEKMKLLRIKFPRYKKDLSFTRENLKVTKGQSKLPELTAILEEVEAARDIADAASAAAAAVAEVEALEQKNLALAQAQGSMGVCGCCFDDIPLNRMVTCSGQPEHLFCKACARMNAETLIGQSQFELRCMSTDGCLAGYSQSQRDLFLDDKLKMALDRLEQEASLRMAGIDNLVTCPFCPFAAECPPIDVDKEFRCMMEDCGKVSCRYCRLESHIPKSCEEASDQHRHSALRQIEEAMSTAVIRKCNKCGTPFIKTEGCNKMTCTRCRNTQCYICHKSCDYKHFNDRERGGKSGNCPLFDEAVSLIQRHETEVSEAEQSARKRIQEQHPHLDPKGLEIQLPASVESGKAIPLAGLEAALMAQNRAMIQERQRQYEAVRGAQEAAWQAQAAATQAQDVAARLRMPIPPLALPPPQAVPAPQYQPGMLAQQGLPQLVLGPPPAHEQPQVPQVAFAGRYNYGQPPPLHWVGLGLHVPRINDPPEAPPKAALNLPEDQAGGKDSPIDLDDDVRPRPLFQYWRRIVSRVPDQPDPPFPALRGPFPVANDQQRGH